MYVWYARSCKLPRSSSPCRTSSSSTAEIRCATSRRYFFRHVLTACIWHFIPGCLSFRICSIIPAVASPSCRSSAPCRRSKSPDRSSAMLSRLEHKRLRRYRFRTAVTGDALQVYAPNSPHDLMTTYTVLIPCYRTMAITLPWCSPCHCTRRHDDIPLSSFTWWIQTDAMNARFLNDGLFSTVRDDIYIYIYMIYMLHMRI